jgi:hypothetical protein
MSSRAGLRLRKGGLWWLCFALCACNRNAAVKSDTAKAGKPEPTARPLGPGATAAAAGAARATYPQVQGNAPCRGIPSSGTRRTPYGEPVTLKINVPGPRCRIAPDFVGSNYEAFRDWGADVSMSAFQATAFREAGISQLRYPGGAPGDWTDLLMTERCNKGEPPNWGAPAYGELWHFAKAAGVHSLLLQTNLLRNGVARERETLLEPKPQHWRKTP